MSALRYSVPGRETVWVDLGPAPGRRSHGAHDARPVENVGQMVPIMGLPQSTTPARQAQMKAYKLTRKDEVRQRELAGDPRPNVVRCGATLAMVGGTCFRAVGHHQSHRSEQAMRHAAEHRRTGDLRGDVAGRR